ncbi:O-antigen ligase family protein [Flavobacterium cerinum]
MGITFMLVAKINILLLLVLIGCMILFRSQLFNYKQKAVLLLTFILTCIVLIIYVPGLKNRFVEILNSYNKPPTGVAHDSTNIRIAIVSCSAEIAKENYVFGVGFDKLQDTLDECYKANYNSNFYETIKYMTHNYFAYIFLSAGIFGLIAFLFYCYKSLRIILKVNRFLLYIMVSNIFIICFTEDFFYRHYGIFFYQLIFMTFVNAYLAQKEEKNTAIS